jgi:YVTN family beta-propeller protein
MYCGLKQLLRPRLNRCAYGAAILTFFALLLWTGCGDVFRPVANPIQGPTTDPRNFHLAVVVSQNAVGNPGSGMQIDVSGDSNVGVAKAGQQPLFAALQPGSSRVFVSNTDGSITSFTPAGLFGSIGAPSTITLPAGMLPGFLFSTETGTMYAATSEVSPAPTPAPPCSGSAVLAINSASLAIENIMCVGSSPTVLTETPDARKVYSVNSDGTISSINTVDRTVNPPITCCGSPVWAVASLDNSQVFVLDGTSGAIWSINTFTDQPTLAAPASSPSNFMALDTTHNRLYVTSTGPTLRILDAGNPTLPAVTAAPLSLPAGTTPVMVTFLPSGTAAYVLSQTSTNAPVVTVVKTASNTITGTINLPSATANPSAVAACQAPGVHPFTMAASGNSARLYVTNCYASSTSIIDTSTNRRTLTMNSPTSAYPPVSSSNFPPPQNPVFVVAGP